MYKILTISIVASLVHLLAGCALKLDDFVEMTAAQRAKHVCNSNVYVRQYNSQIDDVRSSKSNIENKIYEAEKALRSGFWVDKSCKNVIKRVGSATKCRVEGDEWVCREEDEFQTATECETIRTPVDKDLETKNLTGYRHELSVFNAKVVSLQEKRRELYNDCHAKVIQMSPEEAFQLYQ